MSPQPHREKDAKAEGRGPPDEPKDTMATFKALTKRLLAVSPAELQERERLYEEARAGRYDPPKTKKPKGKASKLISASSKSLRQPPIKDSQ